MKNIQLLFIPLLLVIFSFKPRTTNQEPSIVGIWVMQKGNAYHGTYTRVNQFLRAKRGMQFFEDGTFINRMKPGRCGTPLISYVSQKGTWRTLADDKIKITYDTWGGKTSQLFKVKELKQKQMVLSFIR